MKRTELKRRTPLKRSTKRESKADAAARRRFYDAVLERDDYRCIRAGEGECTGALDAHHVISKQTLKAHASTAANVTARRNLVWDPRNGVTVCRGHHAHLTVRADRLTAGEVPPEARDFAREHAITHLLERELDGR